MKQPKPIKITTKAADAEISICSFRDKYFKSYIRIDWNPTEYGFIEDRDIKRLKAWCEDCLRKRK